MSGTRLLDVCRLAVAEMKKAGADLCDASASEGRSLQVEVRENAVLDTMAHRARSLVLRAVCGKRVGTFDLHSLADDDVARAAALAVETARNAERDEDFRDLPYPEEYPEVEGVFDAGVEELGPGDAREAAAANVEKARERFAGVVLSGAVSVLSSRGAIANSNGVEAEEAGSFVSVDFFAVFREGEDVGSFFDFSEGRGPGVLEDSGVASRAAEKARMFLGGRSVEPGKYRLLLAPLAAYDFFRTVVRAASAEAMQRERSFLCGMTGRRIAPEFVDVADDPLVPGGVYSGGMDGEGAARRRVEVVAGGVLEGLLHSSYTANKAGVPNTGHGGRLGGVYPTNMRVGGGDAPLDEMIRRCGRAVLLMAGSLECDPVNGKVNSLLDYALRVEGGEVKGAVSSAAVSGNFLEMLGSVEELGEAEEVVPGSMVPPVLLGEVEIR